VVTMLAEPVFNNIAGSIAGGLTGYSGGSTKVPSFAGGGWTGGGARVGGLDGKGGFMAMLHPNENVVDNTTGGGGDGGVIRISLDPGLRAEMRGEMHNVVMENNERLPDMIESHSRNPRAR